MLHPSFSELMTKINNKAGEPVVKSRYTIVMGTAKRARQLVDKGYMELSDHSRKPLSIAVEELDDGDIRILTDEENAEYQSRFAEKLAMEAELLARKEEMERIQAEAKAEKARQAFADEDDEDDDADDEASDEKDEEDFADEAEAVEEENKLPEEI